MAFNALAVLAASGFNAYAGSTAFIGKAYANEQTGVRFFIRGEWADMRGGDVAAMLAAGMTLDVDFRVGGTAGGKVQVRWNGETLLKLLKSGYTPVFKATKARLAVASPPSEEEVEEIKQLLAASK